MKKTRLRKALIFRLSRPTLTSLGMVVSCVITFTLLASAQERKSFTADDRSISLQHPADWKLGDEGFMSALDGVGFSLFSDFLLEEEVNEEPFAALLVKVLSSTVLSSAEALVKEALSERGFSFSGERTLMEKPNGRYLVQPLEHVSNEAREEKLLWELTLIANDDRVGAFVTVMNEAGKAVYESSVAEMLESVELAPIGEALPENKTENSLGKTLTMQAFVPTDKSYKLSYPADWVIIESNAMGLAGEGFLLTNDPELFAERSDEPFVTVAGEMFINPVPGFAEALVERWFREGFNNFVSVSEPRVTEAAGVKQITQRFKEQDGESDQILDFTLVTKGLRAGALVAVMNPAGEERFGLVVQDILNSVEVETDLELTEPATDTLSYTPTDGSSDGEFGGSFTVEYPANWILGRSSKGSNFDVTTNDETSLLTIPATPKAAVLASVAQFDEGTSAETYHEQTVSFLNAVGPLGGLQTETTEEGERLKGYYLYRDSNTGLPALSIQLTIIEGGLAASVTGLVNLSGYPQYAADLEAILESFVLNDLKETD